MIRGLPVFRAKCQHARLKIKASRPFAIFLVHVWSLRSFASSRLRVQDFAMPCSRVISVNTVPSVVKDKPQSIQPQQRFLARGEAAVGGGGGVLVADELEAAAFEDADGGGVSAGRAGVERAHGDFAEE